MSLEFLCQACGLRHEAPALPPRRWLHCARCAHPLHAPRAGSRHALPLTLSGALLFACLPWLPIVQVEKLGIQGAARIHELGAALRSQGFTPLGWLVDFTLLLAPALMIVSTLLLCAAASRSTPLPQWRQLLHLARFGQRWAMLDVLLLAVLVSFLKVGDIARASFEPGFAVLAAATILLILGQQALNPAELEDRFPATPEPNTPEPAAQASLQPAWALLTAAAFALVPANLFPFMEIQMAGKSTASTIFGGIVHLASGGMWGIAVIVFIASFLVPLGKLAGLAWLLTQARNRSGDATSVRLHARLDFIGRWSMLDVLLVGVLAALIQFGGVAQVKPGTAATAFAAAVILTVLAVESLPLRRLFPVRPHPQR